MYIYVDIYIHVYTCTSLILTCRYSIYMYVDVYLLPECIHTTIHVYTTLFMSIHVLTCTFTWISTYMYLSHT